MGDAPVRAGLARDRHDGPAFARDLAFARRAAIISPRRSSRRCARSCSGSARTSKMSSRSWFVPACGSIATSSSRSSSGSATGASIKSRRAAKSRCGVRSSTCTRRRPIIRCASICGATRLIACRSSRLPINVRRSTLATARSSPSASCCQPPTCEPGRASCCKRSRGGASSWSGWPKARRSTAWSRGCRG